MGVGLEKEKFNRFQDAGTLIVWYLDFIGDQQRWPSISETFCLKSDQPNYVGRAVEEDECPVADPRVSRRHAMLEVVENGLRVRDLGSVNGTFVNGVRISAPVDLVVGDKVTFDRVPFRVRRSLNIHEMSLEIEPVEHASAGLARKRLLQARQERLIREGKITTASIAASDNETTKRYLQSRYHSFKPVMIGSCLAIAFAASILYLL